MFSTSSGHVDFQVDLRVRWGKVWQAYGAYVWVFLLLLSSMLVMLLAGTTPSPALRATK